MSRKWDCDFRSLSLLLLLTFAGIFEVDQVAAQPADSGPARINRAQQQQNAPQLLLPLDEYIKAGGTGTVTLRRVLNDDAIHFSISSSRIEGETCALRGRVEGLRGVADSIPGFAEVCYVKFSWNPDGSLRVDVDQPSGTFTRSCNRYCEGPVGFAGTYLVPDKGCASAEVKETRSLFLRKFRAKEYAEAQELLIPLLAQCRRTLSEYERGQIANDLAITFHRLGNDEGCQAVLSGLVSLATTPDRGFERRDGGFSKMREIARATRTNLKLCNYPMNSKARALK